jgi:hypothetical protein
VAGALLRERRMMMVRAPGAHNNVYKGLPADIGADIDSPVSICIDFFLPYDDDERAKVACVHVRAVLIFSACALCQLTTTARVYSECRVPSAARVCLLSRQGKHLDCFLFALARKTSQRAHDETLAQKLGREHLVWEFSHLNFKCA